MKRLGDLESARHVAEQQADRVIAENAALSKEVERFRYQAESYAAPSQVANTEPVADPRGWGQGAMPPKLIRNFSPQLYCMICASRDFYQVTYAWLLACKTRPKYAYSCSLNISCSLDGSSKISLAHRKRVSN